MKTSMKPIDMMKSVKRMINNNSNSPAARRVLYLCLSVLLALNIAVAMLPVTPSVLAEGTNLDYRPVEQDDANAATFEELKALVDLQLSVTTGSTTYHPPKKITITLTQTITVSEQLDIHNGDDITIKSANGVKLMRKAASGSDPAFTGSFFEVLGTASSGGTPEVLTSKLTLDNVVLASASIQAYEPLVALYANSELSMKNRAVMQESNVTVNPADNKGGLGGAVIMTDATSKFTMSSDSVIRSCKAKSGGAVYMKNGQLTGLNAERCTAEQGGGALLIKSGTANNLSINKCSAKQGGAIYITDGGIVSSTGTNKNKLYDCSASDSGGAVYLDKGTLKNCEIDGKKNVTENVTSAKMGGGIFAHSGEIANITVKNCCASVCGGGMALYKNDSEGVVTLSGNLDISGCSLTSGDNGPGKDIFINGTAADGYSRIDIADSVTAASPVTVSLEGGDKSGDIYVYTTYDNTTNKYQDSHISPANADAVETSNNNLIVYNALIFTGSSDKNAAAIKDCEGENSDVVSASPERVFSGVFSPAPKTKVKYPLRYTVYLNDGTEHQSQPQNQGNPPASGASAQKSGSTSDNPNSNKLFQYIVYNLKSENGNVTASVVKSEKKKANAYGDITLDMDFPADSDENTKLAAVLYPYQNVCKIGNTEYAELVDAIKAADSSGTTIKLLRDCTLSDTVDLTAAGCNKQNVILDGCDHTIYRADDFGGPMFDLGNNNFKFKDVTVSGMPYMSKLKETDPVEAYAPLVVSGTGTLTLENAMLWDNNNAGSADDTGFIPGGGIYKQAGEITADKASVIADNKAANGAGIYTVKKSGASEPELQITGVRVLRNKASDKGGGIYADENAILKDITVQDNTAGNLGGGVYAVGSTRIRGENQIDSNRHGSSDARSDFYLSDNTKPMVIDSSLSPSSIIGVKNFKEGSVVAKADGTNVTSVAGLESCFFPDVDSPSSNSYYFEPDTENKNIICRTDSGGSKNLYTVTANAGEYGQIAPNGEMLLPKGNHTFSVTPDEGYLIERIRVSPRSSGTDIELYKNNAPVTGNSAGSVRIDENGKGELTCNITGDCDIYASFSKASSATYNVNTSASGGNSSCTVSRASTGKAPEGGSDTITFTTGANNFAYVLSDIKVGGTSVRTDNTKKKISDYPEITEEIASDGSLKYTYKLNDIRADKSVEGIFKEAYKQDTKSDKATDPNVSVSGSYIAEDAVLSVQALATSDPSFDAIKKAAEKKTDYKIKQPTASTYSVYDIKLTSENYEQPYRDELSLKFYVGKDYKGADCYAYHVTDEKNGTVDTTLTGKVDNDGYFTVKTKSLSPYGVIIPSGAPVSPDSSNNGSGNGSGTNNNGSGTNNNGSGTNNNGSGTANNGSGTNNNGSGTNNNGSTTSPVQQQSGPSTGDRLPPYVIPTLIISAAVVIILGTVMIVRKVKKNKSSK